MSLIPGNLYIIKYMKHDLHVSLFKEDLDFFLRFRPTGITLKNSDVLIYTGIKHTLNAYNKITFYQILYNNKLYYTDHTVPFLKLK